jgi:hypothetical protein
VSQHRDLVGAGKHLVEFVGDQHDGSTFVRESPHDPQQFFHFGRRQDSGGLIEQEDARAG